MSTAALLTELDAAGVRLSLAGDDVRYETRPGVSIAPLAEHIKANKPALLKELLQREIVEALDVEPSDFDHERYDALWARLRALEAADATNVPKVSL